MNEQKRTLLSKVEVSDDKSTKSKSSHHSDTKCLSSKKRNSETSLFRKKTKYMMQDQGTSSSQIDEPVSQQPKSKYHKLKKQAHDALSDEVSKKRKKGKMYSHEKRRSSESPRRPRKSLSYKVHLSNYVQHYSSMIFLQEAYKCHSPTNHAIKNDTVQYNIEPYNWWEICNFIHSEELLKGLQVELSTLKFHKRNCDLFQFVQSNELRSESSYYIQTFKKILYNRLRPWISELTGIPLTDKVDISCSAYRLHDYLLCHDDQLAGRKFAFIFYLVSEWNNEDGGSLDLFGSENGNPTSIVCSILPEWNKLLFFEVSPKSYHQVSEILSDKLRLSISGWFYVPFTKVKKNRKLYLEPPLLYIYENCNLDLRKWINFKYLTRPIQKEVKRSFVESSEIELTSFFKPEMYREVYKALLNTVDSDWDSVGPPNKRHFKELLVMPPVVEECLDVLRSDGMCRVLSNLTGLSLHTQNADTDDGSDITFSMSAHHCSSKHIVTIRQWNQGDYTLLHDDDYCYFALEANLFLSPPDWKEEFGGYTSYIAEDDGSELLRVEPVGNCLALVYRDDNTSRFVKYINSKCLGSEGKRFFDINVSYFE